MKKEFIIAFLLILPAVHSISGTPDAANIYFKPNLVTNISFIISATNTNVNSQIYLSGDVAQYAKLDKEQIRKEEIITVSIQLPKTLEPGMHFINVHAKEQVPSSTGIFAGSGVTLPIKIFVPYEGKYIEATLEIAPINTKEQGKIKINVKNIGTESINALSTKTSLEDSKKIIKIIESKPVSLPQEESKTIEAKFSTENMPEGKYEAITTIFFDNQQESLEKEFYVGDLIIDLINYTNTLTEYKINKFSLMLESKWNNPIENVAVDIMLKKEDQELAVSTTSTTNMQPREKKEITTFLDLSKVERGEYDAFFAIKYVDKTSLVKGRITVVPKLQDFSSTIVAATTILILLILLIVWHILLKKGKKKNAKDT